MLNFVLFSCSSVSSNLLILFMSFCCSDCAVESCAGIPTRETRRGLRPARVHRQIISHATLKRAQRISVAFSRDMRSWQRLELQLCIRACSTRRTSALWLTHVQMDWAPLISSAACGAALGLSCARFCPRSCR